jgi:hypothetical protein
MQMKHAIRMNAWCIASKRVRGGMGRGRPNKDAVAARRRILSREQPAFLIERPSN